MCVSLSKERRGEVGRVVDRIEAGVGIGFLSAAYLARTSKGSPPAFLRRDCKQGKQSTADYARATI